MAVVCIVGGLVYGWTNAQKRRWSLMWILLGLAQISLDWFVGGWLVNPLKSFEFRRVGNERTWDEYGDDDDDSFIYFTFSECLNPAI